MSRTFRKTTPQALRFVSKPLKIHRRGKITDKENQLIGHDNYDRLVYDRREARLVCSQGIVDWARDEQLDLEEISRWDEEEFYNWLADEYSYDEWCC